MNDTYTTGHVLIIEKDGEMIDAYNVCSDTCHQELAQKMNVPYGGWNGCHEMNAPQYCENCKDEI